ncbi:MAG: Asp-tRNA(Asn)/Glu-tRNA(Gln) amidotransferase subunit GatC [Holosporaceae bacterium]|jgi:aspartyl-tRNA(Asn)/glutamyl-tRNA(Gln) amidotransferase subunit C|nr:Asp-tRNA(Asn)/Glu-tRNA(Gln) amidotransferase subunit GatC [Holosporaceae bacterium]
MSVAEEDVRKVAYLARIRIDDSKIGEICRSLNKILAFVEQLEEVDCSQINEEVQPSASLRERDDVVVPCDAAVMNNAPEKERNMFVVPKVVG